jgi:hypothetical protein
MAENYILLERVELNASAASISFSNIPQTGYTDLKIVVSARTTAAARDDFFKVQINGSSSNFSAKVLYGSGSGAASFSDTSGYAGAIDAANATANTFNNGEFYIPNYTSTTNAKSFSVDTVQEDNQAQAFITMVAGLWNPGTQAAITSITFVPNSGSFVAGSTFSLYGIAAFGTTPAIAPKAYGGNIIDFDGTYWIHTFLTSGTFTPQVGLTCDYLVIAGGGGGCSLANQGNGGGGGGGYRAASGFSTTANTPLTVTVGAGGVGSGNNADTATTGSNSVFDSITSDGGGAGRVGVGNNGGSGGGGGSASSTNNAGGTATSSQGNNGGTGFFSGTSTARAGGGGGGASAAGSAGATNNGGNGGAGSASSITGTSITRAGGGGGGSPAGGGGTGGSGGGGTAYGSSKNGTVNTGGGGGADPYNAAGAGGSGIVIIRYPAA